MVKSSAPGVYYRLIKPVNETILLTSKIDSLLDKWEDDDLTDLERTQAYSKAVHLARRQIELMGYTS